ncbi:hypothetical protein Cgig2_032108 [Carnegiea gigantea]|uniref:Uncharacterized protein n=1 Tax=Carnegiea gigantea TaxID=171969 RepID=A0A9Q1K1P0_9CARY|nr:hypothetical protein Cgig2_032108 [Carnegiea gigantea]
MGRMMRDLQELKWNIIDTWLQDIDERLRDAQVPHLVEMVYNPQPCPEVTLRLRGAPPISSDEDYRYSSTPNILSPEVEVLYSWEITIPNFMTKWPPLALVLPRGEHLPHLLMGCRGIRPWRGRTQGCHPTKRLLFQESVLKKRGCSPVGLVLEIVAEGNEFPGAPAHSDPQDGPGSHFPNPKVVSTLKRMTFEKKYLLPAGYTFVIPELGATVNEPPTKCIAVDTAWPSILALGWGNIPDWSKSKQIRNPFEAPTAEEKKMTRYFYYFVQEDDKPRPVLKFMVQAIESVKGSEKRKRKSSDRSL